MLKLKLQYFGHLIPRTDSLEKRPWCWERLRAEGEGDDRGWGGWIASPNQWTCVCISSGNWWWTGRPGVLQSIRSQRVGHDWATELNWTEVSFSISPSNEYSGLISFRIDWFDLLAVQGTFKGLCQHSSKASILQHSPGCGPTPSWMWFNSHICTFLLEKP